MCVLSESTARLPLLIWLVIFSFLPHDVLYIFLSLISHIKELPLCESDACPIAIFAPSFPIQLHLDFKIILPIFLGIYWYHSVSKHLCLSYFIFLYWKFFLNFAYLNIFFHFFKCSSFYPLVLIIGGCTQFLLYL